MRLDRHLLATISMLFQSCQRWLIKVLMLQRLISDLHNKTQHHTTSHNKTHNITQQNTAFSEILSEVIRIFNNLRVGILAERRRATIPVRIHETTGFSRVENQLQPGGRRREPGRKGCRAMIRSMIPPASAAWSLSFNLLRASQCQIESAEPGIR